MGRSFVVPSFGIAASVLVLISGVAAAQWSSYPLKNTPLRADGKPDLNAPVPHTKDGAVDLSGVWQVPYQPSGGTDEPRPVPKFVRDLAADLRPEDVVMQPWAADLYQRRSAAFGKDFPGARCLPIGIPLSIATPYPFKIVQTSGLIVILYETGNLFRQIYLDGRKPLVDAQPTWMGYSAGHWEGATLVVESSGFNDKTWLDARGHPHSESLRLTERYSRPDIGHLYVRMTVDDPKAYKKPWTTSSIGARLLTDTDVMESICAENERDAQHLVDK
jgi:hypothetical protein